MTPEFSVGYGLYADFPLHLYYCFDRLVFKRSEILFGAFALVKLLPFLEELDGAFQRAKMLRTIGREEDWRRHEGEVKTVERGTRDSTQFLQDI